jgi:hypothetical protein
MENVIVWLVVTLVGSFGGSYLSSYFKRKGENLATHEDIDKLVEQVSAVTKTTKEIEAKISSEKTGGLHGCVYGPSYSLPGR